MIKSITFVLCQFVCFWTYSQTINLEFPYFAGKTYEFKIVQGNKLIVLQNDTIPLGWQRLYPYRTFTAFSINAAVDFILLFLNAPCFIARGLKT